jgi:hypothetical protein
VSWMRRRATISSSRCLALTVSKLSRSTLIGWRAVSYQDIWNIRVTRSMSSFSVRSLACYKNTVNNYSFSYSY